ncbi:gamma-glutamylcyclotransferase family protein [Caldalkalibacillus salinus]|uniref:gamma-glutamylcyclotransferase family protein n=1 Tax=Caldalkalibacillus salinus TaxID=2803787 RepID=UPI00192291B6|nr:gamma-glutamylcyclotransferase family protein [Caldalkalibacillus salinus]
MAEYYFAYGSCMDEVDFRRTVPEFRTLGGAILKDYRLVFSMYGESRAGGVADVIPSSGHEVQGVLYKFPKKHLPDLDKREGVDSGAYERIEVDVLLRHKSIRAYTYQVVNKAKSEIAPSPYYLGLMVNGMTKYCSPTYRKHFIERVKEELDVEADHPLTKRADFQKENEAGEVNKKGHKK